MAQFDVFDNPSPAQRGGFPYVVVLQSDQLNHYATRLVMPLARLERLPRDAPRRLAGAVVVAGETLHLSAHLCAPLPAKVLRKPLATLRHESHVLIDAIDAVMSGA